jgi:beta-glucosidase
LAPGESRTVTVTADPRLLAFFDEAHEHWTIAAGRTTVMLGASATDVKATAQASLVAQALAP